LTPTKCSRTCGPTCFTIHTLNSLVQFIKRQNGTTYVAANRRIAMKGIPKTTFSSLELKPLLTGFVSAGAVEDSELYLEFSSLASVKRLLR
jgi:hypothetical protein